MVVENSSISYQSLISPP